MRTYELKLGDGDAVVYAPESGSFDPVAFREDFPGGQVYGLDVEGTALTDLMQFDPGFKVRLMQFATVGYSWVLNVFDPDQRLAAVTLLQDPTVMFCSHTNMDVLSVYVTQDVDITARNWDTHMLATMAAPDDTEGGKDLKTLCTAYGMPQLEVAEEVLQGRMRTIWNTHVAQQRSQGVKGLAVCNKGLSPAARTFGWNNIPVDDDAYLMYAGLDAIAVRRLLELLIPATQAPASLLRMEQWAAGAANRMQLRGSLVDQQVLKELHSESSAALDAANTVVNEVSGLNVTQNVKLQAWLGEHGVMWEQWQEHGGEVTAKGAPSLAKKNVHVLKTFPLDDSAHLVVDAMIEAQSVRDAMMKTQGVYDALCPDGRVRSKLLTIGTVTGRMASKGPNMQNFSKKEKRVRGMFIPDPGHVMGSFDFAQIELRVAAALSGEVDMIEAIRTGADLHQLTADKLGITRDEAKTVNFLILYGGGAGKLSAGTGKPLEECRAVINGFWEAYPAIAAYNQELMTYTGGVRTPAGRFIPVGTYVDAYGRTGKKLYKNLNSMIQSTARDLIVDAWWKLEHVYGLGDMVWGLIHDEIVLSIPEDRLDEVMINVKHAMTSDFMGVPIEADGNVLRDEKGVSRWGK